MNIHKKEVPITSAKNITIGKTNNHYNQTQPVSDTAIITNNIAITNFMLFLF